MTDYHIDLSDTDMYALFPPEEYPITRQQAFQHALVDTIRDQYENIEETHTGGVGVLQSQSDAVTISVNQDPDTLNWDAIEKYDLEVGRRMSIGLGHYHSKDQLVFAMGFSHALVKDTFSGAVELLDAIKDPIREALSRMGIEAPENPEIKDRSALDVHRACLAGTMTDTVHILADGRKISTCIAHMELDDALVAHGTIEYQRNPERLIEIFDLDAKTHELSERVTSISELSDVSRDEAQAILEETLLDWAHTKDNTGELRDEVLERAEELDRERYSKDEWIMEPQPMSSRLHDFEKLINEGDSNDS